MVNEETDDVMPPLVALEEHDVAAVLALLIRTIRLGDELKRDQDLVAEATARIAANQVARSKTIAAFGVFGFEQPHGKPLWDSVQQSLGREAYGRAFAIAQNREIPKLLARMSSENAEDADGERDVPDTAHKDGAAVHHPPAVKDAILGYLRDVGDAGATARAARQHLADVHNITVHEKTPGMTLYRLLKEGRVRRQGRTWYANTAAANNENEAPNGEPVDASETALGAQ